MEGHLRPVDFQEFPTWCRLCPCFVMFIPLWEGTFFHPCFTFLVWPSAVIPYYPKFNSLTLFLTLIKIPRSRTGTIAYVNICTWNQACDQHSYAFWKKKKSKIPKEEMNAGRSILVYHIIKMQVIYSEAQLWDPYLQCYVHISVHTYLTTLHSSFSWLRARTIFF